MFFQIELLYLVLILGTFITLLLFAKVPSGIALIISAVVGSLASFIGSGTEFSLRHFVEGTLGYYDTILVITTAMIFMGTMQVTGALDYISAVIVKTFRKTPTILLIVLMFIIMFPAMVTGSALAAAITSGTLIAPIMIKWGIPKRKTAAIISAGTLIGEVAPPINVPAMVICDATDIAFSGFTVPLLMLAIPLAVVVVMLLGRKYVKPLSLEQVEKIVDTSITKELKWTAAIPVLVLIVLIVMERVFPRIFGTMAMPAMFAISTILCLIFGKKVPLYKKPSAVEVEEEIEENGEIVIVKKTVKREKPDSLLGALGLSMEGGLPAMGLLIGIGAFMEILTLSGTRGWLITNAITMPRLLRYVSASILLPVAGGISSFASASMLGGPYVMGMYTVQSPVMLAAGMSLFAAIGEFLPPAAISSTFTATIVGEKKWSKVSIAAWPAIVTMFVWAVVYAFGFGTIVFNAGDDTQQKTMILILFAASMVLAIAFVVVWSILCRKNAKLSRFAYEVPGNQPVETTQEEA